MLRALRPLVLLLAAAFVVTLTALPAHAYYELPRNRPAGATTEQQAKLKKLAARNEHLRKELEAERECTRKAREELDRLRMQLVQLRCAMMLREKLTRVKAEMAGASRETGKVASPAAKLDKPEVAPHPQAEAAARLARSERSRKLHRLLKGVLPLLGVNEAELEKPRLGSTQPSGKVQRPAPPKKAPAGRIPPEVTSELLRMLQEKVQRHLKVRAEESARKTPTETRRKARRSAWF